MSDSCNCPPQAGASTCESRAVSGGAPCPTNQQAGKPVETLTLKALLALPLTQLKPVEYRFCRASDCPTVYFSADSLQLFQETDLREQVYQKHPADPKVFVCYCFGHTLGSIREEIERTGRSTVIEQVNGGIQAGLCACDIRNPQGSCCLGNVRAIVRQLEGERRE
jgi:hypothetical protein